MQIKGQMKTLVGRLTHVSQFLPETDRTGGGTL